MAQLPLQLPIIQNWSCHNCGGCCREHLISITPEEKSRIQSQNWTPADGIPASQPLFSETRSWIGPTRTQLAHRPDGACVFLNEQGLCRIHAKFGEPAKPLACRIYPYAFHPAGDRLAISLRFSCPSVARNLGQPLARQKKELQELAALAVPDSFRGAPPPRLTPRTRLLWPDTLRIVESLDDTLADEETPVSVKLLRALFWTDLVAQSKFDKIQGGRLNELLSLLVEASSVEVPEVPSELGAPSSIGMTQFRLLAGQYARKDTVSSIDTSVKGRWQQLRNALKLTRGQGTLPALEAGLAEIPFSALQQVSVELSADSEEMFTRYFRVKLQGLHFCGPAYYDVPVIEGFQSLSLVYPATLWIAQWLAASDSRSYVIHADVLRALTLVDHQHGFSPALGQWGARRRVKNLHATGDLQKLIVMFAE